MASSGWGPGSVVVIQLASRARRRLHVRAALRAACRRHGRCCCAGGLAHPYGPATAYSAQQQPRAAPTLTPARPARPRRDLRSAAARSPAPPTAGWACCVLTACAYEPGPCRPPLRCRPRWHPLSARSRWVPSPTTAARRVRAPTPRTTAGARTACPRPARSWGTWTSMWWGRWAARGRGCGVRCGVGGRRPPTKGALPRRVGAACALGAGRPVSRPAQMSRCSPSCAGNLYRLPASHRCRSTPRGCWQWR